MSRRARARAGGRRAYTAKPVHLNAIERAITGAAKLPVAAVADVKTTLTLALTTFGRGVDCEHHWTSMADALNVAESLADQRICSDDTSRDCILAAQAALAAVAQRCQAGRGWTLYPTERNAIDTALWLHGVQLDNCSFREYENAVDATRNRIAAARAGNAPHGAIVIEGAIAPATDSRRAACAP
jgi:hypothetical protein